MANATANGTANGTLQDAPPPFPELSPPTRAELRREYVSGGRSVWYGSNVAATLPHPIDDLTADFGDDLYQRMLFDPQVSACISIFKASILEIGPAITSPVADVDADGYDKAKEICDQAIRMIEDLEVSFDDVLWNLLDSVAVGNKVAEKTYKEAAAIKDGQQILVLDKIKVKPRHTTVFAVDTYMNLVGLLVAIPPNIEPIAGSVYFRDTRNMVYQLISKDKFVISQFRQKDSDPRGTSILRAAYNPWWRKQQIIPEYLKYLAQFAGPSLVGVAAPDTQPVPDPLDATKTISATQALLNALEKFRNMTVIAVPFGADVKPINMQGNGEAFRLGLGDADQQITKAILTQELATEEGKHMARAAAQVHQDVLDTLVRQGKLSVQALIRNQIFRPWVVLNYGEKYRHLAPIADLGATEQRDKPGLWQGIAALQNSGFFTEDQLQALDKMIGIPMRQKLSALAFVAKAKGADVGGTPAPTDPNRVVVKPHERQKPQRQDKTAPPTKGQFTVEDESDDELQAA